ncbi:MAG: hypothetical protein H6Q89_1338 [Myxococcaceae bacterium]|nr:hypothetical protein [Myxococcaceae bacterium]
MKRTVTWVALALALALVACGPSTSIPPAPGVPDAGDAGPAADAGAPPDAGVVRKRLDAAVSLDFPATLKCGDRVVARVTVTNTGTEPWTKAASFRLGTVDDSDALYTGGGRADLSDADLVPPGAQHVFEVELLAPAKAGAYLTDWRMLQELQEWFGEVAQTTVTVTCPQPVARKGRVKLSGHSLEDDEGKFNAVGASLFWAAWAYKYDRPKLEAALAALRANGFDYFRAFGTVGDVNGPDYWDGREIDWRWADYPAVIKGVTDLAYDTYGLRVQWTLIADGQKNIPAAADRVKLLDTFVALSAGREHKIILFEIANEAWQNGFGGSAGVAELRSLTSYLNARTDILVAASAPDGHDCAAVQELYAGGIADVATIHFDRDTSKTEGAWRPVRQPWEHEYCGVVVGSNNEPIGPGSSVAAVEDPQRLNAAAITTFVSNLPFYVFHPRAGIRGDLELAAAPGLGTFKAIRQFVPGDLASWTRKNAHWADSPFRFFAGEANGTLRPDLMWPDLGGSASSGVVRAYGGVKGNAFFVLPIGIKGRVFAEPRRDVAFDVIDPLTGAVLSHQVLNAGERFELTGTGALALVGSFR